MDFSDQSGHTKEQEELREGAGKVLVLVFFGYCW
jgi:hypothetical protein